MAKSIQNYGYGDSMTAARDGTVISGNQRLETLQEIGLDNPIVIETDGTRPIVHVRTDIPSAEHPRAKGLAIASNRVGEVNLEWNVEELLKLDSEITAPWFSEAELAALSGEIPEGNGLTQEEAKRTLAERFGVPPFSVLDARQGYWQERKRAWIALGIESELGRGEAEPSRAGSSRNGKEEVGRPNERTR
jgi:hypothetical protein